MQTRSMMVQCQIPTETKRIDSDYYVEGYATTFKPYVLFSDENGDVYEQIDRNAFDNTIMNDVILQYDHEGRVYARQSNETLGLEVNDDGLFTFADLSKTDGSRGLYEDIRTRMITKMSWRFRIAENGQYYDPQTRTIHITNIKEVLDVSAVSIPANSGTSISARSKALVDEYYSGEEEKQKERLRKLQIKLKLGGI